MDHVYDYIYTLLKANSFHVPVDCCDMERILRIIPIIKFLQNFVVASTNELAKLWYHRNARTIFKKLNTYHSPQQLANDRVTKVKHAFLSNSR